MNEQQPAGRNIDLDLARQRLGEDADDVLPIVAQALLEECPQRIEELQGALANQDAEALLRTAHTLKGAVKIFAAADVMEVAARIEQCARTGDLAAVPDLIPRLKQDAERMMNELRASFPVSP